MARRDTEDLPKAKITRESVRESLQIFAYLKPYRWQFLAGLVFIALSALSTMVFPFLIGELVNVVAPGSGVNGVMGSQLDVLKDMNVHWDKDTLLLLIFLQLGIQMVFSYMRVYMLTGVGERALADLRADVFAHLLQMPMRFYADKRVGELQSRIASDLSQIQDTVTFTLAEFLRGVITLVAGLVLIFYISFKMALVMLSVVPVVALFGVFFGMRIRKMSRRAQDQLADSGTVLQDAFQGITVVKAFTNEGLELGRYKAAIRKVVNTAIANARFRGAFISFMIFSVFGAVGLVVWYGAGLMAQQELAVGDLTKFVIYSAFVGGTLAGFADMFTQMQKAIGATQRVREILRERGEPVKMEPVSREPRLNGAVKLEDLKFAYPSRPDVQVLQGLSFEAHPGQQIAIIGTSGTGKSTLAQLLLQFYKPASGDIKFDGRSQESYELSYLRSQMALVPQDVTLFGGTIFENIAYGKPDATEAEVIAAAEKANAHQFIRGFPEGYQTVVGERGIKLSGGQRQRVAIARAILKDPAILILDEATSSLDSESEKLVQEALEILMKGRTSFVIAHRLSTIRNADLILVLDKGKVAESGTHSALMQLEGGIYRKLHLLQMEEEPVTIGPTPS